MKNRPPLILSIIAVAVLCTSPFISLIDEQERAEAIL